MKTLLLSGLLALPFTVTAQTLTINETNTQLYGYKYQGIENNRESAEFTFQTGKSHLTLDVTGYDIDIASEVVVQVNQQPVGYLEKTPNNDTGPSSIVIPAALISEGQNKLSFSQQRPGWKWGITNLLLSTDETANNNATQLTIDVTDTALYGFNYQGVTTNRESAQFVFQKSNETLTLALTGYDIDFTKEVAVLVNDQTVGYLTQTQNNDTGSTLISIPASLLVEDDNRLSFIPRTPGWKWGITDLRLSSGETNNISITRLQIDSTDSNAYGFNYQGVTAQRESAQFIFAKSNSNLTLDVTGYDIDTANEVAVFLNQEPIGFLDKTTNNGTVQTSIAIPAELQIDGDNALSFQQRTPGWKWGITDLLLSSSASSPDLSGYTEVFSDEFDGTQLDPEKWDTGLLWGPYFPINNEEQLYVDTLGMHRDHGHTPFELTGDTLKITATPTSDDFQPPERPSEDSDLWQPRSYSEYRYNGPTEDGPGYQPSDVNYLSGIITSYESLKMTHGYVEMRAKVPRGRGLWPAFWLLTTHYVEDVPEIDVMEFLGQDIDTLYHTYHYFDIQDNWRKISTPSYPTIADDWTQGFHTFGMAWSPTEIIYYVDGQERRRITDEDYVIPNQSMYLIANLAVGGNWPGAPDADTQFPATFEIDYIRAYKRKLAPELNLSADYQLMFEDEFNGSSLDESKWNTSFLWGPYLSINDEEQYYVDSLGSDTTTSANTPFVIGDGVLSITAREASDENSFPIPAELPDTDASIWANFPTFQQNSGYEPGNYTSGIITSYDSFNFVHGYAEMRARIPRGQGLWPAFWLLNGYYVGQQPEIDILEVLGQRPHQTFHTYHWLGHDGVRLSDQGMTDNGDPALGYAGGFHTYGVRWQRGQIDWYIDGNVVHTYQGEDVPYQVMYVIANLAVGGNWPGSPNSDTQFPASLDIDYIRVYQERHKED